MGWTCLQHNYGEQTMQEYRFNFTPLPPDFRLDWQRLCHDFAWVRDLYNVPQDARYHAEGDVGTHTRLVAEALIDDPQWRALDESSRHIVFVAALVHDMAKGRTLKIDPDGRIGSPRHSEVGQRMARALLWKGDAGPVPPFEVRQRITSLVRYHGLPLRFWERPDPQRAVIVASLSAHLEQVAILARADVLGREYPAKQELLDRVDMFREFCHENACLTQPFRFESDHHRFVYCNDLKPLYYVPFDDHRCDATVLSGLPGSGKDTWLKANGGDLAAVSMDDMRSEMQLDPGDRDAQGTIAQVARERARAHLRAGVSFVWNATNVTAQMRQTVTALCHNYGARVRIIYIECSYGDLLARNRSRSKPVPGDIIERLIDKLQVPTLAECHSLVTAA
jgi:predicted kinase